MGGVNENAESLKKLRANATLKHFSHGCTYTNVTLIILLF